MASKGVPQTKEHIAKRMVVSRKTWFKKGEVSDEKHPRWKGKDASCMAKHMWVSRKNGNPNYCEICKRTDKINYHWANISSEHRRDINDWMRLCVSCHKYFDNNKKIYGIRNLRNK